MRITIKSKSMGGKQHLWFLTDKVELDLDPKYGLFYGDKAIWLSKDFEGALIHLFLMRS